MKYCLITSIESEKVRKRRNSRQAYRKFISSSFRHNVAPKRHGNSRPIPSVHRRLPSSSSTTCKTVGLCNWWKVQSWKMIFPNCLRSSVRKTHENVYTHNKAQARQLGKKPPRQNLSIRLPFSHTYLFMSVYNVFISISRHDAKRRNESAASEKMFSATIYLNIKPRKMFM